MGRRFPKVQAWASFFRRWLEAAGGVDRAGWTAAPNEGTASRLSVFKIAQHRSADGHLGAPVDSPDIREQDRGGFRCTDMPCVSRIPGPNLGRQ